MIRCSAYVVLLLWLFVCGSPVDAQEDVRAYFTAEIGTPLIGEPIELVLTVDVPDGTSVVMPQFPVAWPPFTVREVGSVTMTSNGGRALYQQKLIVTLWEPGDYEIPQTFVDYRLPNAVSGRQIIFANVNFSVHTTLNPDDLNLRPFKAPLSMSYISPIVVGVVPIGLGALAFLWRLRHRNHAFGKRKVALGQYQVAALAALEEINRLDQQSAPSVVYAAVSDALRRYVQGKFGIRAADMTTEELTRNLKVCQRLGDKHQRELSYLLEQADMVKFAQVQPPSRSAQKMLNIAQRWVRAVEQDSIEATE